jgi:serine/threonine protein kinase
MGLDPAARAPSKLGETSDAGDSVTDIGDAPLVRATALEIARGTVLAGRYQVEAVIGRGGSGIVLRAFDRVAQVAVAVKILKPDLAADPRWIERFSRELRLARQIQHPNVCRVFDIGQADGHWFITMELATSGTLRADLGERARERSSEAKLADIRAVAAGLAAIHDAGIVHRDLKPDNFLRLADGRLVLSDFGLATNPADAPIVSIMVGTPHYMAPEVVMGETATTASDVWAAGVVIHEILTGVRPERRESRREDLTATLPSRVEREVLRRCSLCMADEPEDRPSGGAELQRIVAEAEGLSSAQKGKGVARRHANAIWGGMAVLAIALAAIFNGRLWRPVSGSTPERRPSLDMIRIEGAFSDWTSRSRSVTAIEGRVHCFDVLPGSESARVVWGSPRRAEDVDLATGKREPSPLRAETYQNDCPRLSPRGDVLVFSQLSSAGVSQIMRSDPDGANATQLRPGSDPLWLPSGDEIVFDADPVHVGVLSLPTMSYSMLADGRSDAKRHVYRKTVSSSGDAIAVAYIDETGDEQVAVHALPGLNLVRSWRVPSSVTNLRFNGQALELADETRQSGLLRLDWRSGVAERSGFFPNAQVQAVYATDLGDSLILSGAHSSDVWIFGPRGPKRVTTDGQSYLPAASAAGEVIVEKRIDGGSQLYLYSTDGTARQVTFGHLDVTPAFEPNGSRWLYADLERKALVRCDAKGCADVLRDDLAPVWPVSSPDGRHVAYVTAVGSARLHLVDSDGTHARDLGTTSEVCPPVWSSPTSLWSFSGTSNKRSWVEIDVETGHKTGRQKTSPAFSPDTDSCGLESEPPESPFFQRARPVPRDRWEIRRATSVKD